MKYLKFVFVIAFISALSFTSCKKEQCDLSQNTTCTEAPPTDEACLAFFTRWFYDASTGNCSEIGYSGCEQYGFATKEECEECGCD